ncbi:MAG: thermonuclease family protein [Rhodospirillales bacterium]|nr:thermonuclease family protein [Rhodospirillales bacterium]
MRFFLFAFLFSLPSFAANLSDAASIIDGDTVEIHGQRIRLYGIDAPESRQTCKRNGDDWRCGKDAAFALADKIAQKPVECEPKGKPDRYKRTVAVCRLNGEDLNAWMVSEGWALAYRQYSLDYVPQENEAKEAKRGIWASEFVPPWEWRRR